jgi:hypothetical protein
MYGPDSNIEDCLTCDLTSGRNACAHPLRRVMDRYGVYDPALQLAMFKSEASPPEAPVEAFAERARALFEA